MNPALYGPLGTVAVALIAGLLMVWGNKINKRVTKEDIASQVGDAFTKSTARLDADIVRLEKQGENCERRLQDANARLVNRDRATYEFLERIDEHEDAVYRVIDTLARIAASVMTREQHDEFDSDMVLVRQQRADVALAGKALREAMWT